MSRKPDNQFKYIPREKRAAQIIDQLTPIIEAGTNSRVDAVLFKDLTLALTQLLPINQ